jgi:glyoxylase-like metal-dependent hydrolase (beta-lactamase superfamily II)/rhodanese-related sulfurtransferase
MIFRQLFDPESSTYTYLLGDPTTREAILVDPVRDMVERDLQILAELDLKLVLTLETHVHADHIAGSGVLRQRVGSRSVMSEDAGAQCADVMVKDGERLKLGAIHVEARKTPGHTNGCVSYVVTEDGSSEPAKVFTGDALLIRGCGRTDFQQGDAGTLYESVSKKIFTLPEETWIYPGHDYKGRTVSTVGEEKRHNPRLGGSKTKEEFVKIMSELKLAQPKKIAEAVPANLLCGIPQAAEKPPERAWAPIERMPDGVPEVTVAWTREHLGEFRLIDVRELEEYQGELGHVAGSELLPLGTVEQSVASWDREEPIVIVCRSGGRSGRAAKSLESMGFKRIASMRGGMIEWNRGNAAVAQGAPSCG